MAELSIEELVARLCSEEFEDVVGPLQIEDIFQLLQRRASLGEEELRSRLNERYKFYALQGARGNEYSQLPLSLREIDDRLRVEHALSAVHSYEGLFSSSGVLSRIVGTARDFPGADCRVFYHTSCVDLYGQVVECVYVVATWVGEGGEREKKVLHFPLHRAALEEGFSRDEFISDVGLVVESVFGRGVFAGRNQEYQLV
ncbi:hypothetical protein D6783_04400 [Candidatus Woesearchaeota archaeon]|nr:MAG: hypothetical protein D6783_04400 [Candidatus Woesearchaeota archaeon]